MYETRWMPISKNEYYIEKSDNELSYRKFLVPRNGPADDGISRRIAALWKTNAFPDAPIHV